MVTAPMSFMAKASSSLSNFKTLYTPSSPECESPLEVRTKHHVKFNKLVSNNKIDIVEIRKQKVENKKKR